MGNSPFGFSNPSRDPFPPATISTATLPAASTRSPAARASTARSAAATVLARRIDSRAGTTAFFFPVAQKSRSAASVGASSASTNSCKSA